MKTFICAIAALLTLPAGLSYARSTKVLVCHLPPGNPANRRIISVGYRAAMKHVRLHGDSLLDAAGEQCDGVDNTCDGIVDEGFDLGSECTEGLGACTSTGVTVCSPDAHGTICDAAIIDPPGLDCTIGAEYDGNCNGVPDVAEDPCIANSCQACEEALFQDLDQCDADATLAAQFCLRQYSIALDQCNLLPDADQPACRTEAADALERCTATHDTELGTCLDTAYAAYDSCRSANGCE